MQEVVAGAVGVLHTPNDFLGSRRDSYGFVRAMKGKASTADAVFDPLTEVELLLVLACQ